jgi:hypothetical protein
MKRDGYGVFGILIAVRTLISDSSDSTGLVVIIPISLSFGDLMPRSAICARGRQLSDSEFIDNGHLDCTGHLRYLDPERGAYVESICECSCHVDKREWYLSDFGPPPHKILWVGNHRTNNE